VYDAESMPSHPGAMPAEVAGYRLLLPIGVGGMGSVYLGEREVVEGVTRRFAIKLLHPTGESDEALARALIDEARLAATVQHPCVVTVFEAGESNGITYLVMEYVEGENLWSLLKHDAPLPLPVIGRIVLDALAGLEAAHRACGMDGAPLGIVHRDFSPHNLLVGLDGRTRLTDFGIAKAVTRASLTATGVVKGKVGYMAPEQALGRPLDARADVWAAGAVLWEAIAGRPLFRAANDAATLLEVVSGPDPPAVSMYRGGVPAAIDRLLAGVLQREREHRPADAGVLRAELERAWSQVGLASPEEVAARVKESAGERLATRRARIADIPQTSATDATLVTDARAARHRRPGLVVAAVVVLSAGALWIVRSDKATVLHSAALPTIEAPAAATTTSTGTTLRIEANLPIVQLRLDDRAPVVLPEPATSFVVPLEGSVPATVEARTRDGRVARATVEPNARVVALDFPERAPRTRPVPRAPDDDRLAPTP
jgi:eukaryotic-like serine/threonine-protein kinase